jgi:hypothetical protein
MAHHETRLSTTAECTWIAAKQACDALFIDLRNANNTAIFGTNEAGEQDLLEVARKKFATARDVLVSAEEDLEPDSHLRKTINYLY